MGAAVAIMNSPAVDVVEAPSQAEKTFEGATMLIANPLYDRVFKYMMEEKPVAKLFISTIIREEVVDLQPKPQERIAEKEKMKIKGTEMEVQRLDFAARLDTVKGQTALLIEMQKHGAKEHIKRFQRYIGKEYMLAGYGEDGEDVEDISKIYTMFFWGGDRIVRNNFPIIETTPQSNYRIGGKSTKLNKNRIDNMFHHTGWNIQVKNLGKKAPANEAEQMLAMFDQRYCTDNKHLLEIPLDIIPVKFHPIILRLNRASLDPDVRRHMDEQDAFDKFFEGQIKKGEARGEKRGEKKAAKKYEGVIAQKDQDLAQKDQEITKLLKRIEELNHKNKKII